MIGHLFEAISSPRAFFKKVAFHITGQQRFRQKSDLVSKLVWKIFFGNKVAPAIGEYKYFAAGGFDQVLVSLGLSSRKGFFVEAGAHDGVSSSNTKFLELFCDWTGILVEPHPESAEIARWHRSSEVVEAALVPTGWAEETVPLEFSGLMTATDLGFNHEEILRQAEVGSKFLRPFETRTRFEAKAVTLVSLLEECNAPKAIDLIVLDLEGVELDVLRGFPFENYDVLLFLVESRDDQTLLNFFHANGYKLIQNDPSTGMLFGQVKA